MKNFLFFSQIYEEKKGTSNFYSLKILTTEKMEPSIKDSRQSLCAYLHRQGIYLSYLEPNKQLSFRQKLATIALYVNHVAIVFRLVIILVLKQGNPIMSYIVDQNAQIGIARNYFYIVSLIWAIFSNLGGLHLRMTELSSTKQKWTGISELFHTQRFHGEGNFEVPVKITILLGNLFFYSGAIVSFLYVMPFFFWSSKEYWLFGIIAAIHQSLWGGIVASWTMLPLFCLHMYVFGRLFKMKSKSRQVNEEKLDMILEYWIAILKELKDVYYFYQPLNQAAFASTFLAQVLVAYYVFFSNTSEISKLVFSVYFLLNLIAGQSLHFFASSFTQRNVSSILDISHHILSVHFSLCRWISTPPGY